METPAWRKVTGKQQQHRCLGTYTPDKMHTRHMGGGGGGGRSGQKQIIQYNNNDNNDISGTYRRCNGTLCSPAIPADLHIANI